MTVASEPAARNVGRAPGPLLAVAVPLALVLVTLAVFLRGLAAPFIFDDMTSIVDNPAIRKLWPPDWLLASPPDANALAGRPLVSLSLALSHAMGGLDVRAYHAFSLVLHALNGLLLLGVLRRTLARHAATRGRADALAAAVSVLWLVHPLQTEPVVYAVQRTELLMAGFYLATLYASLRAWEPSHRRAFQVLAVCLCALGMATKEVMVTAPIMIVLYDRAFVTGSLGEALRRRWGFYAGLAGTWATLGVLLATGEQVRVAGPLWRLDFSFQYLLVQGQAVLHYLRLVVWPDALRIVYDWPVRGSLAHHGPYALVTAALAAATLVALWRNSWSGFLGAWFFLILSPSSSVVPLPTEVLAERRMYLPLAAVLTLGVVLLHAAVRRVLPRPTRARAVVTGALVGALAVALAVRSVARIGDYLTVVSIWADAVRKSPDSAIAHSNLGRALQDQGRREEAKAHFRIAIQLAPKRPNAYQYLGVALAREGRQDEAEPLIREAVRLEPGNSDYLFTLASFLATRGAAAEAETLYRRALALEPADWQAQAQLGRLLLVGGRRQESVAHLQQALRLAPRDPVARDRIALALAEAGMVAEAERELRALVQTSPDEPILRNDLGAMLSRAGRSADAILCFQHALRLRPGYTLARYNLASALAAEGRAAEALAQYRQVVIAVDAADGMRARAAAQIARLEAAGAGLSGRP